jgi:hypothetical protein
MKPYTAFKFLLTICSVCILSSCNRKSSCYDEQLYQKNKNNFCTTDCPGVIGCDGKTYCNECEANRQGIKVK